MPDEGMAEVIRDLGMAVSGTVDLDPTKPDGVIVPAGARLEIIDPSRFDALAPVPRRPTGKVQPQTLGGLVDYVDFHADANATSLWVHATTGAVVAVLNDHAGAVGDPGWGDHRAEFTPRFTPEWQRWTQANGKWLEQEAFAELLEDGLTEIADPAGATLLEVASTMSGRTDISWEAAVRLDNGAIGARYVEDMQATAGRRGDLEIPTQFALVLSVFAGEQPVQLAARLRWRLRDGELKLCFKLDNPHRAVDESVEAIAAQLRDRFSHVYVGTPRS